MRIAPRDGDGEDECRLVTAGAERQQLGLQLDALPCSCRSPAMACRPMCTSPPPTGSSRVASSAYSAAMSAAVPVAHGVEVALDEAFQGCGVEAHGPHATRADSSAASEVPALRDRQIAHLPAAHIRRVGTVDPVAAHEQFRRVQRTSDDDRAAGRQPARRRQQRRVGGIAGHRDLKRPAHRRLGDRQPVPGRTRGASQQRRVRTHRRVAGRDVPLGVVGVDEVGGGDDRLGDQRGTRRCRAVDGSAGRTISASASSAVSNHRPADRGPRNAPARCRSARRPPSASAARR